MTARPAAEEGARRGRLVQAPAACRLAELRRARRRGAAGTARGDRGHPRRAGQVAVGRHRNSSTFARWSPPPTRRDRWRRTSGIHKVRNPRTLAAVRELWTTRDRIASRRDIAPGRILPDAAIINAATEDPDTVEKLTALPIFGGTRQRRSAQVWLEALARARTTEDLPDASRAADGPAARGPLAAPQARGGGPAGGGPHWSFRTVPTAFGADGEPAHPRDRAQAVLGLAAGGGRRGGDRRVSRRRRLAAMAAGADGAGARRGADAAAECERFRAQPIRSTCARKCLSTSSGASICGQCPMSSASITTSAFGNDLGVPLRHVGARVRVDRTVDQPHRHRRLAHGPHPAIAVRVAVVDEATDLVQHAFAVVVLQDLVELLHQRTRRLGVRAEHLVDRGLDQPPRQRAALKRTHDVAQRSSRHQLLHGPRRVGLVEHAAVEPGDRLVADRAVDVFAKLRGAPAVPDRPSRRGRAPACGSVSTPRCASSASCMSA